MPGDPLDVLVYATGHGLRIDGAAALVPVGTPADDPADLDRRAVRARDLAETLVERGARSAVVAYETCADNPFTDPGIGGNATVAPLSYSGMADVVTAGDAVAAERVAALVGTRRPIPLPCHIAGSFDGPGDLREMGQSAFALVVANPDPRGPRDLAVAAEIDRLSTAMREAGIAFQILPRADRNDLAASLDSLIVGWQARDLRTAVAIHLVGRDAGATSPGIGAAGGDGALEADWIRRRLRDAGVRFGRITVAGCGEGGQVFAETTVDPADGVGNPLQRWLRLSRPDPDLACE